jgi:arylsulfatase A-like enzyme
MPTTGRNRSTASRQGKSNRIMTQPEKHIDRRQFLKRAVCGTAGLSLTGSTTHQFSGNNRRPNLLVILTDDQTYRAIGYTQSLVQTPNLNQLAGEGLIFENTYVASPICVASRSSLLTGVFPQQHGSVGLDAKGFHKSVVETQQFQTLAQVLSANGYHTAFTGKSHLGSPRDYGFTEGEELFEPDDRGTFDWAASYLGKRALDGEPFLLWLATRQPHIPLQPGAEWLDLYRDTPLQVDPNFLESPPAGSLFNQGLPGEHVFRDSENTKNHKGKKTGPPRSREEILDFTKAYYATISHLDTQIGDLVKDLKLSGLYDNTVLVFLSDNGYQLGNHGLGNKITMHEESVRVPMFIHWSGLPTKGIRCQELTSSLDLFPTLLDLAGIQPKEGLEGRSLVPLFSAPTQPIRSYAASECVGVGGSLGMGHRMVRSKQWKYILTDVCEEALFNEIEDPFEMTNLAAIPAHRQTLELMRNEMRAWMKRIGDTHVPPPAT